MMSDLLLDLENWFASNCDGDWEHQLGVRIETLDNPGWSVDIDLQATAIQGETFLEVREDRDEYDWVRCWVDADVFKGRGGPKNLGEILRIFISWSSGTERRDDP